MDFPGGRRLDLAKAGSIDVRPDETRSAKGNGSARAFLFSIVPRGVRGFDRRGVEAADKAAALSPRRAKATERQPLDPKPATCRQARSRWRPDDREVVRRPPRTTAATPRARRISKRNAGGFSHGALRAVSEEGVFAAGARERNVGCRSGFEAPRRCVQGKPRGPTRSTSSSDRKARSPERGPPSFSSRKGAMAREGRKAGVSPRLRRPSIRWHPIEPRRPVPRLLIESVEGAWGLVPVSAKHASWRARPRLRGQARQFWRLPDRTLE